VSGRKKVAAGYWGMAARARTGLDREGPVEDRREEFCDDLERRQDF